MVLSDSLQGTFRVFRFSAFTIAAAASAARAIAAVAAAVAHRSTTYFDFSSIFTHLYV
jgi:hypothetical protein